MASLKVVRNAIGTARIISARMASSSSHIDHSRAAGIDIVNFNPNNYNVPLRPITMDDTMEPYGPWKQAYEAEKKRGNRAVVIGALCFTSSLIFFYHSGALEGLDMPNLDNIMEETEPFNFDTEGRVSVSKDDD